MATISASTERDEADVWRGRMWLLYGGSHSSRPCDRIGDNHCHHFSETAVMKRRRCYGYFISTVPLSTLLGERLVDNNCGRTGEVSKLVPRPFQWIIESAGGNSEGRRKGRKRGEWGNGLVNGQLCFRSYTLPCCHCAVPF